MARITKGVIQAARAELACIRELATDPQAFGGSHATYLYHAPSASRHLATLTRAGEALPEWFTSNQRYFEACNWRVR